MLALEAKSQAECGLTADHQEGIRAFLEKAHTGLQGRIVVDDQPRLAEFEARIARGEKIEPGDSIPPNTAGNSCG